MVKSLLEGELVLAIDFDGTITTEPDMGKELVLQPECKRVLERLHDDGIRLILWTCRTGPAYVEAVEFLDKNGMLPVFDAFNTQLPEVDAKYAPNIARKVGADFYVDDKNLMAKIDWNEIEAFLYGREE